MRRVTWHNVTASYTKFEEALMRGLTAQERWFIHKAKAEFKGSLR